MSIRRPSHLKEDLVLAFLTVIAITIVMDLWQITVRDYSTQAIKLVSEWKRYGTVHKGLSIATTLSNWIHCMVQDMKIMMRNLSRDTTEAELLILFQAYGDVQYCKLVMDKVTGKSKGFGFVEMPRAGEAKAAIKGLNYRDVSGNKIRVKKAEKHEESVNGDASETSVS